MREFGTTYGFRFQPQRESESGFSLLEVVVNLFLFSILSSLVIRGLLSMWTGATALTALASRDNDWRNITRTFTHDVHSAVAGDTHGSALTLDLVDGTRYRYYLNNRNQLIRDRSGGGTTVLGTGVTGFNCEQNQQTVTVTVQFQGLFSETLTVDTLRVITR